MKKLVIDTDIGTDVDDLFALIYAIKNPRADIIAISTVHGDTTIRGKIVRKLERILNVDIPIIPGESCSKKMVKKYWTGFEKLALTKRELKEPLQERKFPEYEKGTALACIGPLTNIALQLKENESIKNVQEIYLMGSSIKSHNFKTDPKALKIVQSQHWKIKYINKYVSEKISFRRDELENLKGNELGNFVYESSIRWLDYAKKDTIYMYDVLTLSAAIGEDFVKFREKDEKIMSYDVDPTIKNMIIEAIKNV